MRQRPRTAKISFSSIIHGGGKILKVYLSLSFFAAEHRAVVRRSPQPTKALHGVLGIDVERVRAIQGNIDALVKTMSDLLRIERDAELEFTQEELNAISDPDENSDSSKPIEYLVSHGQAQHELCDTICNLNAISSSTGGW